MVLYEAYHDVRSLEHKVYKLVLSQKSFLLFYTISLHVHVPDIIVERLAHLLIFHEMKRQYFFRRLAVLTDSVYFFQTIQGNIMILPKIGQNHFLSFSIHVKNYS